MSTCDSTDFLLIRNYADPLDENASDGRGHPLTMRPLVWQSSKRQPVNRKGSKKQKLSLRVGTVAGSYSCISPDTLYHKVCIVPDYKLGPEENFLVNDIVHVASEDLQL